MFDFPSYLKFEFYVKKYFLHIVNVSFFTILTNKQSIYILSVHTLLTHKKKNTITILIYVPNLNNRTF